LSQPGPLLELVLDVFQAGVGALVFAGNLQAFTFISIAPVLREALQVRDYEVIMAKLPALLPYSF
jgi:hypothetical protein